LDDLILLELKLTTVLSVFDFRSNFLTEFAWKTWEPHVFQLYGVATDNTAVADVHAPIVAGLSAVAGNLAAVWVNGVNDVPVISAVGLLLSTLKFLIFFHLVVNALL
jgi:hypothetical protein